VQLFDRKEIFVCLVASAGAAYGCSCLGGTLKKTVERGHAIRDGHQKMGLPSTAHLAEDSWGCDTGFSPSVSSHRSGLAQHHYYL